MSQTPAQKLADTLRAVRRERVAVVAFLTAGFPSKERFREDLIALGSEANVVEIGVPFTDPMADGVTIQRASHAAIASGVSLRWILDELRGAAPFAAPLVLLASEASRARASRLFVSAVLLMLGGFLLRINGYLVGYETGSGYHYFPSVPELLVTIGLVAFEILAYIVFVRTLPVLPKHATH